MMNEGPFPKRQPSCPPLTGDLRVRVAIVGGGLTGLSTAYHLRDLGADVALLARSPIAAGSSGAFPGVVSVGLMDPISRVVPGLGEEGAFELWAFSEANLSDLLQAIRQYDLPADLRGRGVLYRPSTPTEAGNLEAAAALLRQGGMSGWELLRHPGLWGGDDRLGLLHVGGYEVSPDRVMEGLLGVVSGAGVRVFESTEAGPPERVNGSVKVTSAEGSVVADILVVAAGPRAATFAPVLKGRIHAVRAQALATQPVWAGVPNRPVLTNWGHEVYRPDPAGRLLVMGVNPSPKEADFVDSDESTPEFQSFLEQYAFRRFQGLRGARIEHRWGVPLSFSEDGLPVVGAVPGRPEILVGAGYGASTWHFAFRAGKALADLIRTGKADLPRSLSPRRWLS